MDGRENVLLSARRRDQLEHQVGLAGYDACVQQACDLRVREAGQHAAFALESLYAAASHQREAEEFDRRVPLVATITAPRQPDAAHSAVPERPLQRVVADHLLGERRSAFERNWKAFEELRGLDLALLRKQTREFLP